MKHHLMIGGTGRAGTSFLVQYFHACGVETVIRDEGLSSWDEKANAGLESFVDQPGALPYVVKSAWFHEFVERFVADPDLVLDAVLIPMRDVVEAASSRVINDYEARMADPATPSECASWERWGMTPGGVVYSLNPLDQARILALSFHSAIHTLVRHDVPLVFLDFPRFIEDADYLFDKLKPYLPPSCDAQAARRAHAAIADRIKVRTGRELEHAEPDAESLEPATQNSPGIRYPSGVSLATIAARRLATRATRQAPSLRQRIAHKLRGLAEQLGMSS